MSLRHNFEKKPSIKNDFVEFMQGLLDNHHEEVAPPLQEGKKVRCSVWWCVLE